MKAWAWHGLGKALVVAALAVTLAACNSDSGADTGGGANPGAGTGTNPGGGSGGGTTPPPTTYLLRVTASSGGSVSADAGKIAGCTSASDAGLCSDSYGAGAAVMLRATASPDYSFAGWGSDCGSASGSAAAATTVTMDGAHTCSATFEANPVSPPVSGPVQPRVSGHQLIDARTGKVWTPHGSSVPSLEYACVQGWTANIPDDSMSTAAAWGMDVMRLPLNQDCWLGADGAPGRDAGTQAAYQARVRSWVKMAHDAGMVVILDLHWSAPAGTLAQGGQWPMADAQSRTFWASVAAAFKDDPSVMFELFNEPYSWGAYELSWECWSKGGCQMPNGNETALSGGTWDRSTYTVTGMADLVAAVRGAGADQVILLGGLDYASDLSKWLERKPDDAQLAAAWHNYKGQSCANAECWNSQIAKVAAQVPVVITEFGYENGDPGYFESAMAWADSAGIGYLPWAWWDQGQLGTQEFAPYALFTCVTWSPCQYVPTLEGQAFRGRLEGLGR